MTDSDKKRKLNTIFLIVAAVIFAGVEFLMHRGVKFINDDLWYMRNISGTNADMSNADTLPLLKSFKDIWESQVWHFYNWGGRNITHAVLQMVLMTGEVWADVLNMVMTVLLSFIICKIARVNGLKWYLAANVCFILLNASVTNSILWESGSVNYLYSSVWIFTFAYLYLQEINPGDFTLKRQQDNSENTRNKRRLPGIEAWIIPLAVITGWSNENMGPASFCLALGVIVYNLIWERKKPAVWMIEGAVFSLAGCIPMLLAPGNFVRSAYADESSLAANVLGHLKSEFIATFNFLFPVLAFTIPIIFIYVFTCGMKLGKKHVAMLVYAVLAHGAMVLSPTYPSRATFGVMIILIALDFSLLKDIFEKNEKCIRAAEIGMMIMYAVTLILMAGMAVHPPL